VNDACRRFLMWIGHRRSPESNDEYGINGTIIPASRPLIWLMLQGSAIHLDKESPYTANRWEFLVGLPK